MRFNTAISAMMEFVNAATKWTNRPRMALEPFVLLLRREMLGWGGGRGVASSEGCCCGSGGGVVVTGNEAAVGSCSYVREQSS